MKYGVFALSLTATSRVGEALLIIIFVCGSKFDEVKLFRCYVVLLSKIAIDCFVI